MENGDADRFQKTAVKSFAGLDLDNMSAPASTLSIPLSTTGAPAVSSSPLATSLSGSKEHDSSKKTRPADPSQLSQQPQQNNVTAFDPQLDMLLKMAAESAVRSFRTETAEIFLPPTTVAFEEDLPSLGRESPTETEIFLATPWPKTDAEVHSLQIEAHATEVLKSKDPRRDSFADATATEDRGLAEKQVFKEVRIPKDARKNLNVLRSRYVFA
eukprot:Plantae.Rhodophyta-Palmaria_palmata.ctg960.p2 GENE.Plantae.Rhodophyta-Palmaria_palmata.ctg960~~Plantae.Rhodophyta-Palmaria_palmata.ctg960.p2  ORF type:complete len:214 (-),score=28.86 Plantae.Rhodophyta-Palmaria_palmata.ctg960:1347-1988(-)